LHSYNKPVRIRLSQFINQLERNSKLKKKTS